MFTLTVTDTKAKQSARYEWVTSACSLGSSDENLVQLDGWLIPAQAVRLEADTQQIWVSPISTSRSITLDGVRLTERTAMSADSTLKVFHYLISLKAHAETAPSRDVAPPSAAATERDELMDLAQQAQAALIALMDQRRIQIEDTSEPETTETLTPLIDEVVTTLTSDNKALAEELRQVVFHETVGLGALEVLLQDSSVTEIMVNNYDDIYVERDGRLIKSEAQFSSPQSIRAIIDRIISPLGRRIDESSPIVDARLKDGSRVNAIIPPLALRGPSITIRKFPERRFGSSDLLRFNSASKKMIEFLEACVLNRCNIIVSGGTGSGKTTLLNILSNYIPEQERVITVEDAAELQLGQPHVVSLEARPANMEGRGQVTIRDLVKNCLRMRPDRIVVGECRGGEALDMLQAMNTGHDGSFTTAHANSPADMLRRLEVMVLMAGMDLPIIAIREQVASAVDIVVQQTRYSDGSRRITQISEITGIESGTIQLNDLFVFKQRGFNSEGRVQGDYLATGSVPEFYEDLTARGLATNMELFSNGE